MGGIVGGVGGLRARVLVGVGIRRERWAGLVVWMPSWAGQLGHGWPSEGGCFSFLY